jgi:2-polyprenyl-6-hydroxyphenyl methylase/3-demethylubiquinone-9 3-methyltransferase
LLSKLAAIKVSQQWKRWAFAPPNLHIWNMFIKPDELKSILGQNNLEWKEHLGLEPNVSLALLLHFLRKRAKGMLTYKDIGRKLYMVESNNLNIMYMGYAVKVNQR